MSQAETKLHGRRARGKAIGLFEIDHQLLNVSITNKPKQLSTAALVLEIMNVERDGELRGSLPRPRLCPNDALPRRAKGKDCKRGRRANGPRPAAIRPKQVLPAARKFDLRFRFHHHASSAAIPAPDVNAKLRDRQQCRTRRSTPRDGSHGTPPVSQLLTPLLSYAESNDAFINAVMNNHAAIAPLITVAMIRLT
jgi:hypothetical protein